ncbi:putative MFS drug efflux transporter [Periconia macrospinosa]|uniref:Putative MFS drug efflux transporter n=1 Tax=Periconia macrospinosa TaxID=97972 RepID=A0A2V1E4B1_9PLEO|nr:putative MFS drug efflux transporter [Periconia macrospinosa]
MCRRTNWEISRPTLCNQSMRGGPHYKHTSIENLPTTANVLYFANGEVGDVKPQPLPRDVTGWKWFLASTAILSSIFLYALDNTIVAAIQPIIVTRFDSIEKLPWLSVAFLLAATATNMVWGQLYGQFNSKWLYVLNVFLFEVGSAICGAAPNIDVLIVGRAICGLSGSGLYVGVMTLIAVSTTMAERPLYISGTGITWGLGIVLGPIVGGGFSESSVGWRWAFYINLLIGAVCAPAWLFLLPSKDPRPGVPYKQRITELDYAGTVLLMAALTTFVLAINWGGVVYAWSSGRIIALFVASGVLFIILGVQQAFTVLTTVARRIIPVQFFRSKTVLILFAVTAASGSAAFVPIYFVPLFFQFTRNDGPLDAGVRLLPLIVVMVVTILANGALMAKFGYYMPWYLFGGGFTVAGSALMYTVDQDTSASAIYGYTVLIGVGVGMFLQASFSVAQAVVDPENIPPAVGFITLAQFLGITMALAISNSVFLNESEKGIAQILPNVPLTEIQAAINGAASQFVKNLDSETRGRVLGAIVKAIDKAYILVIAAGSLVASLSFLMKRERLFSAPPTMAA